MINKIFLLIILFSTFTYAQRTAYTTFGYTTVYDTGAVVIEPNGNSPAGFHIKGTGGGWIFQGMSNDALGSSSGIGLFGTGNAYNYNTLAFIDSTTNKSWNWGYRTGKTTTTEKRRLQLEYYDGSAYNIAAYFDTTYSLIFPTGYVDADSFRLNGTTALTKATWHSGIGASSMGAVTLSSLTSQGGVSGATVTASSNIATSGDYIFNATNEIRTNSSDGSDNYRIGIVAGGGLSVTRSPYILLYGNQYASTDSHSVIISAGNENGYVGYISIQATDVRLSGDLQVNGDDITSDADLTITPAGGDLNVAAALTVTTGLSTFNGTNSGTATIGAGDSVQVAITGITIATGQVQLTYNEPNSVTPTKFLRYKVWANGTLSIYGDAGLNATYWVHKK